MLRTLHSLSHFILILGIINSVFTNKKLKLHRLSRKPKAMPQVVNFLTIIVMTQVCEIDNCINPMYLFLHSPKTLLKLGQRNKTFSPHRHQVNTKADFLSNRFQQIFKWKVAGGVETHFTLWRKLQENI